MARNTSYSFNWTSVPIFPPIIDSPPPAAAAAVPPFVVYPDDSLSVNRGYAVYGCFIVVLVIVFIAIIVKISYRRKRPQTRNVTPRQNIRARQNQLSTVSRAVDANSNNTNNAPPNTHRRNGSDETLKFDLPPTYEEVMKNYSRQTSEQPLATLTILSETPRTPTTDTHGGVSSVEIVADSISPQRSVV